MYIFRCPICGLKLETTKREPMPLCPSQSQHLQGVSMRRDYAAEGANIDLRHLRSARR